MSIVDNDAFSNEHIPLFLSLQGGGGGGGGSLAPYEEVFMQLLLCSKWLRPQDIVLYGADIVGQIKDFLPFPLF